MQLGAGSSSPDPFLARTIRLDNDQLFAARPEYPGTFWNCKEAKLRQAWAKVIYLFSICLDDEQTSQVMA